MRHGLRAGKLPLQCASVEVAINGLRRQIEDAVLAAKGSISLTDAAAIDSAIKHERHGQLALWYLRKHFDKLSPIEQLKFSGEIAKASEGRDRALQRLKLDRDTNDGLMDALYSRPLRMLPAPGNEDEQGDGLASATA